MLRVPKVWADLLEEEAKNEDPLKDWSAKAREIIKEYLADKLDELGNTTTLGKTHTAELAEGKAE